MVKSPVGSSDSVVVSAATPEFYKVSQPLRAGVVDCQDDSRLRR